MQTQTTETAGAPTLAQFTGPEGVPPELAHLNIFLNEGAFYTQDGVDYVILTTRADNPAHQAEIHKRVSELAPSDKTSPVNNISDGARSSQWKLVGPAYEAWKRGEAVPEGGHPVGTWPAIDRRTAETLKSMGYRTLEEIAVMDMETARRLMVSNGHELPRLARETLAMHEQKGKDEALNALMAQNAELSRQVENLNRIVSGNASPADASLESQGSKFKSTPLLANDKLYPSKTAFKREWGWSDKKLAKHEREGTFEEALAEDIAARRADGREIPNGDPALRAQDRGVSPPPPTPDPAPEASASGAGGEQAPPAEDEGDAAKAAIVEDGSGGQAVDISKL